MDVIEAILTSAVAHHDDQTIFFPNSSIVEHLIKKTENMLLTVLLKKQNPN